MADRATPVRRLIQRVSGRPQPRERPRRARHVDVDPPIDLGFLSLPWELQDALNRHAAERDRAALPPATDNQQGANQ